MKKLTKTEMNSAIFYIRDIARNYIETHSLKSVVIGVSGGIDSALVCALLKPVCDRLGIPLIGRSIAIDSNKQDEIDRAEAIGKSFCTDFKAVDLTTKYLILNAIDEMEGDSKDDMAYKIRMGNIKARMRMIYLYNLASKTGGLVMGTENITEHYLGFCTLHGDSGTDFEPIIGLWKTEVYQIAEYLVSQMAKEDADSLTACIICNATDGLGVSNTDLDQILPDWKERHTNTRSGYEEVDDKFIEYFDSVEKIKSLEFNMTDVAKHEILKKSPIIKRFFRTDFKRNNPFIIGRDKLNLK